MPSVDIAMARSLQPGALELIKKALIRSVERSLARRDIVAGAQGKINDVQTAFSSWDNCMQASFCKWPVIAIIVIGSLIILSIVWCMVRCLCCGLSCCCSCFRCLKCCGNCCGCCDPPGGRKHKYLDEPYIPPHHGYRTEAPMQANFSTATTKQPVFESAQYAEFDVSKKGGEDALPQMPSWDQSGSKKVHLEEEEVEMANLKQTPTLNQNGSRAQSPAAVSQIGMNHNTRSPYGVLPTNHSGQMSNHSQQALVPNSQPTAFSGHPSQGPYGAGDMAHDNYNTNTARHSVGFGLDEPYDDAAPTPISGASMNSHPGQRTPQPFGAAAVNQPYGDNSLGQPYGAAAAVGMRSQTSSPYDQSYRAPPAMGANMGPGGRQSPAPGQVPLHNAYGQEQPYQQVAEMPASPRPMPLAGSPGPDGYGMRRPGTGDGARPPPGMDPRMRNSPGPRQSPGPQAGGPYTRSPPGSPAPRQDQYGRPPQFHQDNGNRGFGPGPARQYSPGPERQYSPAPDRQRTPRPHPLANTIPSSSAFVASPPHSPITNNAGFDFTSGYSRGPDGQSPPRQSPAPTAAPAYPGQKPYQSVI